MNLGFFRNWGGNDSLVWGGERAEIRQLIQALRGWQTSMEDSMAIHELPYVTPHKGTELYVVRHEDLEHSAFQLICDNDNFLQVLGLLEGVAEGNGPGHQYLDLIPNGIDLVVSCDEYPTALWTNSDFQTKRAG